MRWCAVQTGQSDQIAQQMRLLSKSVRLLRKRQGISMLTRDQVRMARTALRWTIKDLGEHSGITPQTVTRFENGGNATLDTLMKIKLAFEKAGVTWVPENGGPAGVRPPRTPAVEGTREAGARKNARAVAEEEADDGR